MRSASWVGPRSDWRASHQRVVGALQLERDDSPGKVPGLRPVGQLFREPPDVTVEKVGVGGVLGERRLVREAADRRVGGDASIILAARQVPQTLSGGAEAGVQVAPVPAEQVGEGPDAGPVERAWVAAPTPQMSRTGRSRRKRIGLVAADHREAARLVEVGCDLRQELVVAEADEPERPSSAPSGRRRRASMSAGGAPWSRAVPVRSRNASSSESGSTAGVSASIIARIARLAST